MPSQTENKEAEQRLQAVSEALELAAADLTKLVEKMRKTLEENRLQNLNKGDRGEPGPPGPRGPPGKDS